MTIAPEVTQLGMPLEQFLEEYDQEPFELIRGERILKMPTKYRHSSLAMAISRFMFTKIAAQNAFCVMMETTFVMPGTIKSKWVKDSRVPDVMYYEPQRLKEFLDSQPDPDDIILEIVPDFIVEIISPTDTFSEVVEKVESYLEDGVRLVWLVDFKKKFVMVYRASGDSPITYRKEQVLDANGIIEGVTLSVDDLFALK